MHGSDRTVAQRTLDKGSTESRRATWYDELQPTSRLVDLIPMTIRVIIADDHPLSRDGLRQYLQMEGDMEVVGE